MGDEGLKDKKTGDSSGGWTEVKGRREIKKGNVTTFFISNIPMETSTYNLWKSCQAFGRVTDAFIPRKKSLGGVKFGFVRYAGVIDKDSILKCLNSLSLNGAAIKAEVARYDRDNRKIHQETHANQKQPEFATASRRIAPPVYSSSMGGRSYKDAMVGGRIQNQGGKELELIGDGAVYPKYCIGRSVLGVVKDAISLNKVVPLLEKVDRNDAAIVYIGGLSTLIIFKDRKEATSFIELERNSWGEVFDSVNLWSGQETQCGRVVELRIHGVPLVWRDGSTYDKIGNLFGRVIENSSYTWSDEIAEVGAVRVLSYSTQPIDEVVVIKWRDRLYKVWVKEGDFHFEPRFERHLQANGNTEEGEFVVDRNTDRYACPEKSGSPPVNVDVVSGNSNLESQRVHGGMYNLHGEGWQLNSNGSGCNNEPNFGIFEVGTKNTTNVSPPKKRRKKRGRNQFESNPGVQKNDGTGNEQKGDNNSYPVDAAVNPPGSVGLSILDESIPTPMNCDNVVSKSDQGAEPKESEDQGRPNTDADEQDRKETLINTDQSGPSIVDEVSATIEIGKMLGFDLSQHVDMVTEEVVREFGEHGLK